MTIRRALCATRTLMITAAVLVLTGAFPVAGPTPPTAFAQSTPRSLTIVIPHDAMRVGFSAGNYRMARGGLLRVTNRDTVRHTVTSVAADSHHVPLFDASVAPGKTVTVGRVGSLRAGTYRFYCSVHPSMRSSLTLVGSGGTTSAGAVTFDQPLTFPRQVTWPRPTITMKRGYEQMMPTGPKTAVDGYDGTYPGPTIVRPAGYGTSITFVDGLPVSSGPYSVHLHGDHHAASSDGQPMSYLLHSGQRRTYTYPLRDAGRAVPPSFGFYHDHAMGSTGRNNWDGMQGMFIVGDGHERALGLPTGYWDRPLLIADRTFDSRNQLVAVRAGSNGRPTTGASAPPGDATVGNRVLVNGRYRPYLDVYTHQYRLRLLNGSNYQSYDFVLSDGRSFLQVGTGSSLLPRPVRRTDILLGPAQRADVVVNFAGEYGKRVVLASVPRRDGSRTGIGTPSVPIMQFRVTRTTTDTGRVHSTLEATPGIRVPSQVSATWNFGLGGNARTGTYWTINGKSYDPRRVDLTVPLGSTQRWRLVNSSPMTHYVHLHEEQWHTILRDGRAPPAYEQGLQDTWRLDPGESVEVAASFTDFTGVFMIHCHMLDHEDDGMMAQFAVVDPSTSTGGPSMTPTATATPTDPATAAPSSSDPMSDMPMSSSADTTSPSDTASPSPAAVAAGTPPTGGSGLLQAALATGALCLLGALIWLTARRFAVDGQWARTRSS